MQDIYRSHQRHEKKRKSGKERKNEISPTHWSIVGKQKEVKVRVVTVVTGAVVFRVTRSPSISVARGQHRAAGHCNKLFMIKKAGGGGRVPVCFLDGPAI